MSRRVLRRSIRGSIRGGIDPYLWEPITGVQTLDFKPFRVDLTPFAGVLADGKAHMVGLSVFNTEGYFAVEGNLLVYTDKGSKKTTGRVTANNLNATPKQTITNGITTDGSGNVGGSVTVASQREYTIVGTLTTSHGVVTTRVDGQIGFSNKQTFILDNNEYKQYLQQSTDGGISTTTTSGSANTVASQTFSYPFTFDYDEVVNADGTIVVHNVSNQNYVAVNDDFGPGYGDPGANGGSFQIPYVVGINEQVFSSDDLNYDASGNFKGHGGHSYENYLLEDSKGKCYSQSLTAVKSVLTGYTNGAACK